MWSAVIVMYFDMEINIQTRVTVRHPFQMVMFKLGHTCFSLYTELSDGFRGKKKMNQKQKPSQI